MSENNDDVEVVAMTPTIKEPFSNQVSVGFPQGNIVLQVTTTAAMLIQAAFISGGTVGLTPEDAKLKGGATFVGLNGALMLMLEITPIPSAEIITATVPGLIIPGRE